MTPKSSDIEFWTIKYQKANGPPPPPNPNYAPKTRLAEVFKTNPVISLFDCQASHEHADDLWACHANPLHRGRIITTRHTRWPHFQRIVTGTGGFTVSWFVAMFENLTKNVSHMVCLIWKFSRGGWRTAFLQGNTKWRTNCYHLCSLIKDAHFKEFWILILQYNNSLRAPWKRCTKIELKSKHRSKELWVEPNGHNRD